MQAKPLDVYNGALKYVVAIGRLRPDAVAEHAAAQAKRVVQEIGSMTFSQDDATELLMVLADTAPCPFDDDQKTAIGEALIGNQDGDPVATTVNRTTCKEQDHNFMYDYFPQLIWDLIRSDDSLKNKFKHTVHFCVETLQLRNASAQTRRLLVAIVHEASGEDKDPDGCFQDFTTVTEIFRQKRMEIQGAQSLKVFPENASTFVARYPGAYPDEKQPVKCPLAKKAIKARTNKSTIPCRGSNAKVSNKKKAEPQPKATALAVPGSLDTSTSPLQMLTTCLQFMQGKSNQVPHVPETPLAGLKIFTNPSSGSAVDSSTAVDDTSAALVGRKDSLPGCLAKPAAKCVHGNLAALRDQVKADLGGAVAAPPPGDTDDADDADAEVDDNGSDASEPVKKKPAAKTAKTAKAAIAAPVPKGKPIKAMKAMKAMKAGKSSKKKKGPMLDGNPNPSAAAVLKAKVSCMKFASAIAQLKSQKPKKNRPKIAKNGKLSNAEYMSGRIYTTHGGRPVLRVYTRKGDTHEQRIPYDPTDKADTSDAWHMACSAMEIDPRKVKD